MSKYEGIMRANLSMESRVALASVCLLLFTLACDREPGIIVNIAAWPDGVELIRVRTIIEGTVGTDIFIKKDQTRFAVRVPTGSQGTVQIDAAGLDTMHCKLAAGSLSEPVPDNLSRLVERRLELSPLPGQVCIFRTSTQISVGNLLASVAVGDFNGDTKPDLAIANHNMGTVIVLLGDGLGGFGPAANFAAGPNPRAVAVGDFNSDGHPDLSVTNDDTINTVSVLLGDGLGGFGTVAAFSVGANPQSVAVGDFNGDMKLDLVVANFGSNKVSLLLGNGLGGFGPATSFMADTSSRSVAVGDA